MSEIQAGDGWRLLNENDVVDDGDEIFTSTGWLPVYKEACGYSPCGVLQYRRRIPAKPEPFGVVFYEWRVINGKAVIRIDMERAEFNAKQARQLADWLTRYADWREAAGRSEVNAGFNKQFQ